MERYDIERIEIASVVLFLISSVLVLIALVAAFDGVLHHFGLWGR